MALEGVVTKEVQENKALLASRQTASRKLPIVSESLASISICMKENEKKNINDLHHLNEEYVDPLGDDYIAEYLNESQHTDHVGHGIARNTLGLKNGWQG